MKLQTSSGFTLIEILVALVVLLVGMMGAAGLLVRTVQQEAEAYQRLQALNLLQDIVDRVTANKPVASCYSNGADGVSLGHKADEVKNCSIGSVEQQTRVVDDLLAWQSALLGAGTKIDGTESVGAMVGARGCIRQIDAAEQIYRITVAWQGLNDTAATTSANTCGKDQYGDEKKRRTISVLVRIGDLS